VQVPGGGEGNGTRVFFSGSACATGLSARLRFDAPDWFEDLSDGRAPGPRETHAAVRTRAWAQIWTHMLCAHTRSNVTVNGTQCINLIRTPPVLKDPTTSNLTQHLPALQPQPFETRRPAHTQFNPTRSFHGVSTPRKPRLQRKGPTCTTRGSPEGRSVASSGRTHGGGRTHASPSPHHPFLPPTVSPHLEPSPSSSSSHHPPPDTPHNRAPQLYLTIFL